MMSLWHCEQLRPLVQSFNNNPQNTTPPPELLEKLKKMQYITTTGGTIFLEAPVMAGGCQVKFNLWLRDSNSNHVLSLASLKLTQTEANCSSLLMTEVTAFSLPNIKTGFGKLLIKLAIDYALRAKYSFIHCSMNSEQFFFYDKVLKPEFKFRRMGTKYRNPRSGKHIMWAYKTINQRARTGYF